jgi:hypothetical protein
MGLGWPDSIPGKYCDILHFLNVFLPMGTDRSYLLGQCCLEYESSHPGTFLPEAKNFWRCTFITTSHVPPPPHTVVLKHGDIIIYPYIHVCMLPWDVIKIRGISYIPVRTYVCACCHEMILKAGEFLIYPYVRRCACVCMLPWDGINMRGIRYMPLRVSAYNREGRKK